MDKRRAPSAPEELRQRTDDASDKEERSTAAKKPARSPKGPAPPLTLAKSGVASAASGGAGAPDVIDLANDPLRKPVEIPRALNGEPLRVWPPHTWQSWAKVNKDELGGNALQRYSIPGLIQALPRRVGHDKAFFWCNICTTEYSASLVRNEMQTSTLIRHVKTHHSEYALPTSDESVASMLLRSPTESHSRAASAVPGPIVSASAPKKNVEVKPTTDNRTVGDWKAARADGEGKITCARRIMGSLVDDSEADYDDDE